MNLRSWALVSVSLATGCATLHRAQAAEAMQCPESELEAVDMKADDAEGAKLLVALVAVPLNVNPLGRTITRKATESRFRGCGRTFDCDRDGCDETAQSRAARLSKSVPQLMEKSRLSVGADATAEQVGYFTWTVTASRGTAQCRIAAETYYSCSPDLDVLAGR